MQATSTSTKSLRELVSTLFIYKRTIFSFTATFSLAALVVSFFQPQVWEASVQVWAQDHRTALFGDPDHPSETSVRLKTLLTNLRQVVYSHRVLETALRRAGALPAEGPDAKKVEEEVARFRRAIRLDGPKGTEFGAAQIFFLRVRGRSPEKAKRLLDSLLDSLRQRYKELIVQHAHRLYQETTRQVEESRRSLEEVERGLDEFVGNLSPGVLLDLRSMQGNFAAAESNPRRGLNNVNDQLAPLGAELREEETLLLLLRDALAGRADPLALPANLIRSHSGLERTGKELLEARLEFDGLAARTTEKHAQYQTLLDRLRGLEQTYQEELDRAVVALEQQIDAKRQGEAHLLALKESYRQQLAALSGKYVEYTAMEEERRRWVEIVAEAERRRSTAAHAQLTAAEQVLLTNIDPPRSGSAPVSPRRSLQVIVAAALGLLGGLGLVFLRKEYSHVIWTEADLAGLAVQLAVVSLPSNEQPIHRVT